MFDTEVIHGQAIAPEERGVLPAELDQMVPGPALAMAVAGTDVHELSGYDRVVLLRVHQRLASHFQAMVAEDMAAIADHMDLLDDDPELANATAAAEIRAALCLTRRAADDELATAVGLRRRLPRVWDLLASGAIDACRARVLLHATSHLTEDSARVVIELIADDAPSLTTGQLRARLRKLCIDADPADAELRYETAVDERRVVTELTASGTAHLLGLDLPPDRVAAAMRRIDRLARSLKSAGETRTMDQLRADVLVDLLAGTAPPTGRSGVVDVHVDLATLAGLVEHPGELAGYGPVIADIARRVAESQRQSEWRYTVTDPQTGRVLHTGITRRRPTEVVRREVEAHHPRCVFPGCRVPARRCDLDHRIPWADDGPTAAGNLFPLCRPDHVRRHNGWAYRLLADGTIEWTSRLGHTYVIPTRPP